MTDSAPRGAASDARPSPSGRLVAAFLASGALVLSEWLFFATKPSFLGTIPVAERLGALAAAASLAGLAAVAAVAPFLALGRVRGLARPAAMASRLPAAALFAVTALLVLDGTTVTLFRRGIRDALSPASRLGYGLLLAALLVLGYGLARRAERLLTPSWRRRTALSALAAAGAVLLGGVLLRTGRAGPTSSGAASGAARDMDVVLLGADGLEASRTSLYGASRDTTPFLRQLGRNALVVETAFTNSGQTTGSITSLLTGKLPTTTRVHYPPDALRAIDAYEHLPGLLRRMGYRTFFAGVRHYADPLALRLVDGFDDVGGARVARPRLTRQVAVATGDSATHLLNLVSARIEERLAHVVLGVPMPRSKRQVSSGIAARESDDDRFRALVRFLEGPGDRKFAHAHLLGTHGPGFSPRRAVFSGPGGKAGPWDRDAQDDAILDFDDRVRELFAVLERTGRRHRTIVVITSDHGQEYRLDAPVPLVFVFPEGGPRGRVRGTAQLLDVAPTLLDALGVPKPSWMRGSSLLRGDLPPCRTVLAARSEGSVEEAPGDGFRVVYERPWYSLGHLALISCSGTWWLHTRTGSFVPELAPPAGSACDPACAPVRSEASSFFRRALARGRYPVGPEVPPLSVAEALALASAAQARRDGGGPTRVLSLPAPLAERAAREGEAPATRAEAAVFAGLSRHAAPPEASHGFSDVGPEHAYAAWIALLAREVREAGCSAGRFCPDGRLDAAEMRRWLQLPPLPDPNG